MAVSSLHLKKKRWLFYLLIGVCLGLGLTCIHVSFPQRGIVRDAETGEPLSEAVAVLELRYTCYFPPNLAGPSSKLLGFQEAVSDVHGAYKFPLRVYFKPPLSFVTDKFVKYFRPGYSKAGLLRTGLIKAIFTR